MDRMYDSRTGMNEDALVHPQVFGAKTRAKVLPGAKRHQTSSRMPGIP